MSGKRKLVSNSLALLVNRLTQSITTFALTAAIARFLGADALGQYLLAFSYYFIFVSIASQGLKTLLTRELAREPESIPTCLVSGTVLQLVLSVISYVVLVMIVTVFPYSDATTLTCYLMGLMIIPFSLSNITEAIFQAQERMHLIAVSTVPVYGLRLGIMIWAMSQGYGVNTLVAILIFSEFLVFFLELLLLVPTIQVKWRIEKTFIWKTIQAVQAFFLIESIAVISNRAEILVLSLLGSEFLIGLYGGINQLLQPFLIVANSIVLAAFPRMSKAVGQDRKEQRKATEQIVEMLFILSLPLLIGILLFTDEILLAIYGSTDFLQASIPFKITALSLLLLPIARPFSYLMLANGMERANVRQLLITTISGLFAGFFLISSFKLLGAALMRIFINSFAFTLYFHSIVTRLFWINLWQTLKRPLLISVLMLPVFLILQFLKVNFLTLLITSMGFYSLIIGILGIHLLGGPQLAWAKLTRKG